jgi:hypothetical protein
MKYFSIITLALITILSGCSSIEVSHDYDSNANFTKIKSYQWLPEKLQTKPRSSIFAKKNPLIAKRIKKAIENEMTKKGFVIITEKADAYISYHMSKNQKVINRSRTSFGIGLGTGFNSGFGGVGLNLSPEQQTYQEAHLTIDIKDKNQQLIWRGKSTSPIKQHPKAKETTELINEIVEKILEQYPPK